METHSIPLGSTLLPSFQPRRLAPETPYLECCSAPEEQLARDEIMTAGRDCYGTLGSFSQIVIKEIHRNPFSSPCGELQSVSPFKPLLQKAMPRS